MKRASGRRLIASYWPRWNGRRPFFRGESSARGGCRVTTLAHEPHHTARPADGSRQRRGGVHSISAIHRADIGVGQGQRQLLVRLLLQLLLNVQRQ